MPKIEGRTFVGKTVHLDGKEWIGCKFTSCRLVFSGKGSVKWHDCEFSESSFHLEGAAALTRDYIRLLFHSGAQDILRGMFPEFFEPRH